MKRIIVLPFLFVSFTSFSQSISFDDIKNINSKESFDRFIIENNFEDFKSAVFEGTGYGYRLISKIENNVVAETIEASYQDIELENGAKRFVMEFEFYDEYPIWSTPVYPTDDYIFILNEVKNQCDFYKIITHSYLIINRNDGSTFISDSSTYDDVAQAEKFSRDNDNAYIYNNKYSCYSCPGSKYPGKICFRKGKIKINILEHFEINK